MKKPLLVNWSRVSDWANVGVVYCIIMWQTLVISMDSVFLLIDIFILGIILLLMPKEGIILKKIVKFFKLLKRRIDIHNAESELKFILENK